MAALAGYVAGLWTDKWLRPRFPEGNVAAPISQIAGQIIESVPLSRGLHVAELRVQFRDLRENRRAEIAIRIFNGTERTIVFSRLSGNLTFRTPNSQDERSQGSLPWPSLRSDTSTSALPLAEWLIVLSQPADAAEAD